MTVKTEINIKFWWVKSCFEHGLYVIVYRITVTKGVLIKLSNKQTIAILVPKL